MNTFATGVFDATLTQANLVTKTDFDTKLKGLNQKITSTKQNIYLLQMNLKNNKHLNQFILEEKVILKKMAHKII